MAARARWSSAGPPTDNPQPTCARWRQHGELSAPTVCTLRTLRARDFTCNWRLDCGIVRGNKRRHGGGR
eukprot:5100357-Prymnesium_polylepis.2